MPALIDSETLKSWAIKLGELVKEDYAAPGSIPDQCHYGDVQDPGRGFQRMRRNIMRMRKEGLPMFWERSGNALSRTEVHDAGFWRSRVRSSRSSWISRNTRSDS